MKILIISPTQYGIGGIAQHVQGLTKFLKKNGHHVEIISSENTFTIPIKGLKNPSFMISSLIKSKFKKDQDIVHAHNIPSALAMKNTVGKKVLSLHGVFSQQIDQLHGKTTGDISEKYENNALKWADAITVVSKEAFDHYTNLGYTVFQVPNAIDVSYLEINADRRYPKQVIFAGRLSREKGTDSLMSIAQKLSNDIHLIILGAGPEEQKIKDLTKTHKNIHFLGYQNKKETISLICGSDILIQPSLQEGISSTLLEAMACKTAIIATNVGGNNELIQNNVNGIVLEPNDVDSFTQQISYLLNNEQFRQSLVEHAFKTVEKYDWNQIGNLYLSVYESILDKSK
ncbi:MAG: glycosyl transferase family 1 [Candidatus Diapherotrites archaeon CG11_big_fil_rev_8_21_14_0_20_37_9]|nr:MAG: glycosyl transferase family 1 [Candidatus Diapherotrites archaeon CG11_big_fil_rev_8_21_14_0_20_37_9]